MTDPSQTGKKNRHKLVNILRRGNPIVTVAGMEQIDEQE